MRPEYMNAWAESCCQGSESTYNEYTDIGAHADRIRMVCALRWRTGDVAEAETGERKSIAMTLMRDVQGSALEPLGRVCPLPRKSGNSRTRTTASGPISAQSQEFMLLEATSGDLVSLVLPLTGLGEAMA